VAEQDGLPSHLVLFYLKVLAMHYPEVGTITRVIKLSSFSSKDERLFHLSSKNER
jgi:hypothetical protein